METMIFDNLPKPNGHYSHCVRHNGTLYVSGILPSGIPAESDLETQFKNVFDTIQMILAEAGSSLYDVLLCHIYVSDLNDWQQINDMYAKRFAQHRPARVVVPVKELHFGWKLEVEVIAAAGQ